MRRSDPTVNAFNRTLSICNRTGSTDLVVDVMGWYF
jgi:hypothetical protein